jgi:hypothetical protein
MATDLAFGRLQPDADPMSEKGIQLIVCRGQFEIADEYHQVVQTD